MKVSIKDLYAQRNEIADWAGKRGLKCDIPQRMRSAQDNQAAFKVLFENYEWALNEGFNCPEFDCLTREQLSPWYVWLLETYCLGTKSDHVVLPVIELHKRVIVGEAVGAAEWTAAWAAASAAAWWAAWAAASAAWATSAAAWDAVWCARAGRDDARDAAFSEAACKLYNLLTIGKI